MSHFKPKKPPMSCNVGLHFTKKISATKEECMYCDYTAKVLKLKPIIVVVNNSEPNYPFGAKHSILRHIDLQF